MSKWGQRLTGNGGADFALDAEESLRPRLASIAELLRPEPELDVLEIDTQEWGITSRHFNHLSADKMLVLRDGRTPCAPLTSGVNEVRETMLEGVPLASLCDLTWAWYRPVLKRHARCLLTLDVRYCRFADWMRDRANRYRSKALLEPLYFVEEKAADS
jgi:hypothetical protein